METLSTEAQKVFDSASWINPEGERLLRPSGETIITIPGAPYEQIIFQSN